VKGAAEEPVKAAAKIAAHPVDSVIQAPVGVARFFGKVVSGAGDAGKGMARLVKPDESKAGHPKPPPSRENPIGYNKARSEWARKLGVDPSSSRRTWICSRGRSDARNSRPDATPPPVNPCF
jgi:hypothetical protein